MRGDDHRRLAPQLPDQLPERDPLLRVQPGGRLVEQQDVRVVDDGLREAGPPYRAAGQRLQLGVDTVGQPDPRHGPFDRRAGRVARHLLQPRHVGHKVPHGESRVVPEVLRQVPDPAPGGRQLRVARQFVAQKGDATGGGPGDGGQYPYQRSLSGPVRAEQPVHSRAEVEVDAVEGDGPAVSDGEPGDMHGAGRRGHGASALLRLCLRLTLPLCRVHSFSSRSRRTRTSPAPSTAAAAQALCATPPDR